MSYIGAVVPWLASSTAKSAKYTCVTWLLTPSVEISSSVVTQSRTQVASGPWGRGGECCPDQPLAQGAQLANRSPSPYEACGITYQRVTVLHAQEET